VAEKHRLWEQQASSEHSGADRRRDAKLTEAPDTCWDRLRQRRARREARTRTGRCADARRIGRRELRAVAMSPVRSAVTVIGRRFEVGDHRLRDFLTRAAQPHEWLEAGTPEADRLLASMGLVEAPLPVVLDGGRAYVGATVETLVSAWNLSTAPKRSHYDLAIVGAGPAGLGAAVYAASDGLATIVLERDLPGGQASHTSMIENFLGFPEAIGGAELARRAGRQAERFGAELVFLREAVGSRPGADPPVILLDSGVEVATSVVIAARG
jgi:thioredoxin reductase (NADPH)